MNPEPKGEQPAANERTTLQVRILKADPDTEWYRSHIGKIFTVEAEPVEWGGGYVCYKTVGQGHGILVEDCEIVAAPPAPTGEKCPNCGSRLMMVEGAPWHIDENGSSIIPCAPASDAVTAEREGPPAGFGGEHPCDVLWSKWLASEQGQQCAYPCNISREVLETRLRTAFTSGWNSMAVNELVIKTTLGFSPTTPVEERELLPPFKLPVVWRFETRLVDANGHAILGLYQWNGLTDGFSGEVYSKEEMAQRREYILHAINARASARAQGVPSSESLYHRIANKAATRLTEDCFTNGADEKARRLQMMSNFEQNLGGWGKEPFRDKAFLVIRDALSEQEIASLTATVQQRQWIPCKTELPSEGGHYLVQIENGKHRVAEWKFKMWHLPYGEHSSNSVVAWQHIEPYAAQQEEK